MKWNILVGTLVLGLGLSTQSFGGDLLDRMLGNNYHGCCDKVSCCDTPCSDPGPSCGCETGCDVQCVPCKPKCRKTPLLDLLRNCTKCKKSACDGCCDAEPACGCEQADPSCGCDQGCDVVCAPKKCRKTPLLDLLRRHHCKKSCCDAGCADPGCGAEPACGCEKACDPGCGAEPACGCETGCDARATKCVVKKRCRGSLLDRIFGCRKCKQSCCEPACGCEASCGCEVVADPCCGSEPACGCEASKAAPSAEPTEAAPEESDEVGPAPVVDPSAFLPTQRRFVQTSLVR